FDNVPQTCGPLFIARAGGTAIEAEGRSHDQSFMSAPERTAAGACSHFPEPDTPINSRAWEHRAAIRANDGLAYAARGPVNQLAGWVPGRGIPQPDLPGPEQRQQALPGWAESAGYFRSRNRLYVRQGLGFAGANVPDPGGCVPTRGEHELVIGAKGRGTHKALM